MYIYLYRRGKSARIWKISFMDKLTLKGTLALIAGCCLGFGLFIIPVLFITGYIISGISMILAMVLSAIYMHKH